MCCADFENAGICIKHLAVMILNHFFQRQRCIIDLLITIDIDLTHCDLVTPYDGIDMGQHWFR